MPELVLLGGPILVKAWPVVVSGAGGAFESVGNDRGAVAPAGGLLAVLRDPRRVVRIPSPVNEGGGVGAGADGVSGAGAGGLLELCGGNMAFVMELTVGTTSGTIPPSVDEAAGVGAGPGGVSDAGAGGMSDAGTGGLLELCGVNMAFVMELTVGTTS